MCPPDSDPRSRILVSAVSGKGIPELLGAIFQEITDQREQAQTSKETVKLPHDEDIRR